MKKIILALLLTTVASTSQAVTQTEAKAYCNGVSGLAESIMSARLSGASPAAMFEVADNGSTPKMTRALITAAFDEHDYQTADQKARVIREFGADYYLDCMQKVK